MLQEDIMTKEILKLVLTHYWFDEIKSGRKKHEYRKWTEYFKNRISITKANGSYGHPDYVQFQRAYSKNPERMTFKIKSVKVIEGINTDLHCKEYVYDIELGEQIHNA